MEKGMIKGSVCVPVPKKSEVRRRHQHEGAKRIKKKLRTKRNGRDKPESDEVKEKAFNAGSKEESLSRPSWEGSTQRDKPNPDEVNKTVVGFRSSKEESMAQLAGEGKSRKMLVTQEMVGLIIGVEIVDYMLVVPLVWEAPDTDPEFAEFDFDFGASDTVMADAEENAYVLRQYRTNKHTEFPTNQEAKLARSRG